MDLSRLSQLHVSEDYEVGESSDSRDRLSELPDSLILEILSFLEMEDVVRTTILSKRWKDLWTTVPCLDFGEACRSFICSALAKWKGGRILKFSLCFWEDHPPSSGILDSWLPFPIEKRVEDLTIYLGGRWDPTKKIGVITVPWNIQKLCFYAELNIKENVQWNQLRSLTIEGMKPLSGDALNKVLSGTPLLEQLVLSFSDLRHDDLHIQSNSLKMLHIGRHNHFMTADIVDAVLFIRAPNLLTFEISAKFLAYCLLDVPSLTNAMLHLHLHEMEGNFNHEFSRFEILFDHVFRRICHVERITLSAWCIQFLVSMKKKKDMVVSFSNAKYLKLCAYKAEQILDVLEMFPNLEQMQFESFFQDEDEDYDDDVEYGDDEYYKSIARSFVESLARERREVDKQDEDECDAFDSLASEKVFQSFSSPLQVKTIDITWNVCDASMIPVIEILLEYAHVLEKMVLRLRNYKANPEAFTWAEEKVQSIPRSSPYAKLIISKGE